MIDGFENRSGLKLNIRNDTGLSGVSAKDPSTYSLISVYLCPLPRCIFNLLDPRNSIAKMASPDVKLSFGEKLGMLGIIGFTRKPGAMPRITAI